MELPIAKQTYLPTPEALVRAVKRADVVLARMVAQEEVLDGAVAFTNPARQGVGDANFATDLTGETATGTAEAAKDEGSGGAELVENVLAWFAGQRTPCAWMDCAGATWAPPLAAALTARGWHKQARRVFVMDHFVRPTRLTPALQIIPARAAYAQLRELFGVLAKQEYGADDRQAPIVVGTLIDQLDEQRVEYYLARLDGRPVACAGVVALGQTGVIRAAFTDPAYRGRGIAGTLMAHVLDHCVRSLYEQVLLDRHDGCPAIPFYEGLGFRPAAGYDRYVAPRDG